MSKAVFFVSLTMAIAIQAVPSQAAYGHEFEPVCFIEDPSGRVVSLEHLCGAMEREKEREILIPREQPFTPVVNIPQREYRCSDFLSQAEAQAIFRGGQQEQLDADGDGLACESLPETAQRNDGSRVAMNQTTDGIVYDVYRTRSGWFYLRISDTRRIRRTPLFTTNIFPTQAEAIAYFRQMRF